MIERGTQKYQFEGRTVLQIHYSADPDKDPNTPRGLQWLAAEVAAYPGGMKGTMWRREMEMDWSARGKSLVFPNWDEMAKKIVIPPEPVPEHWPIYMGYDYGYREPFAVTFIAFKDPLTAYVVDEIYETEKVVNEQARLIQASPYWERVRYAIGDPSIWVRNQHDGMRATSIGELLREAGVYIRQGRNEPGIDIAYRDLLLGSMWQNLERPLLYFFGNCVNHIKEYSNVQFKDYVSKAKAEASDLQEVIASRKVHLWDADKYVMMSRPMAIPEKIKPPPDSVAAIRAEIIARKKRLRSVIH